MGVLRLAAVCLFGACLIGACTPSPPTTKPNPAKPSSTAAKLLPGACRTVSLAASAPSPVTAGQDVLLTAIAYGCLQPEYRFVLTDATGATGSVTQDWSSSATWSWITGSTPAGRYVVRADARATNAADAPPDASAYLAFVVRGGAATALQTCRLPVSGVSAGTGGFIQMPAGTFTADPASNVALPGQPDPSGLRRGYTYDPVHSVWLPVPRDWVMPDFSSYAYVGTEYPHVSNQPALHLVKLPSGTDTLWTNGDQLYGYLVALRSDGVYGAPGPQIITLIDPAGHPNTVDQGHYGLFAVITPSAIWATRSDQPGLNEVQRIDPVSQSATDWFKASGGNAVPIGVDALGAPIIAVGTQNSSGRFVATEIDIVPTPSAGAGPAGVDRIYSDAAHPLTIVGWPILSAGAIWLETDRGLWAGQGRDGLMLVSAHSGFISGGCV